MEPVLKITWLTKALFICKNIKGGAGIAQW